MGSQARDCSILTWENDDYEYILSKEVLTRCPLRGTASRALNPRPTVQGRELTGARKGVVESLSAISCMGASICTAGTASALSHSKSLGRLSPTSAQTAEEGRQPEARVQLARGRKLEEI